MASSVYQPDLAIDDKTKRLVSRHRSLSAAASRRMDEYESIRGDVHWKNDDAYRHIEKAFGELANAYWLSRAGADRADMEQELADALNHMLMALDIGPINHTSRIHRTGGQ